MNILLKNASNHTGEVVTIKGWLFNRRSSGKIHFLQVRDGTGTIQAVVVKNQIEESDFDLIASLNLESSLELTGTLVEEVRSPSGFDLQVTSVKIIQNAHPDYPIGKKEHGVGFLLDNRHLWLRSPRERAIQLVRDTISTAILDYYHQQDFTKIDTPVITPSACEGTTTLFEIDYFGTPGYLSQSGQLYLEAAIFTLNRTFDFAPVFRAEKSKTRRHLIEFWMTNAEAAFVEHDQNMDIQEGLILFVIDRVLKHNLPELNLLERDLKPLEAIKAPFPRLTHQQVIEKLHTLGSDIGANDDLGADDETLLMKTYDQPLFVEKFPANVKAFYMKRDPQNQLLALCADLLAPEGYGEIIGGSQREDDYDTLLASIKSHNLPLKDFQWYLDLRRFGSVPHSGFGLGIERVVAWVCGLKHVRSTLPFPRLINRLHP